MAFASARSTRLASCGGAATPGACVATLSASLFEIGYRFCFLFTDLRNPTSNRLYERLGYEPVCDLQEIRFGDAVAV